MLTTPWGITPFSTTCLSSYQHFANPSLPSQEKVTFNLSNCFIFILHFRSWEETDFFFFFGLSATTYIEHTSPTSGSNFHCSSRRRAYWWNLFFHSRDNNRKSNRDTFEVLKEKIMLYLMLLLTELAINLTMTICNAFASWTSNWLNYEKTYNRN